MPPYASMTKGELQTQREKLLTEYTTYQAQNLKLNMARGKPATEQLDLSMPMLDILSSSADMKSADGTDCRNYGVIDGLPEAKAFMATLLDDEPENVIVFGNASLTIMYDTIMRCWNFGTLGELPWCKLEAVKWICPVPGYDRHFSVTEAFGVEMINVPLKDDGPDMDIVENLVKNDAAIKGIWCVPKYSNPSGITYSDETVQRLASMECAAQDFRIFWDNAYGVHHLYEDEALQDQLLDIGRACKEAGNPHRYFKFASTSKVTFPGAGIAAFSGSLEHVAEFKKHMSKQTIGHDKLNQLRHVRFLKDKKGLAEHMKKHADIIRPKFELVCNKLNNELGDLECGTWTDPRGGYFISFDAPEKTAHRIVSLAKAAGVVMTDAGATYPYIKDPSDSNIRIAPTLPPLQELDDAMDVFVCCVKLARVEQLLA